METAGGCLHCRHYLRCGEFGARQTCGRVGHNADARITELGFAGKGRIYYRRSEKGGFQILAIGGKATQKQDLEYLSRLG